MVLSLPTLYILLLVGSTVSENTGEHCPNSRPIGLLEERRYVATLNKDCIITMVTEPDYLVTKGFHIRMTWSKLPVTITFFLGQ